jgi:hypothetical protein
MPSAFEDRGAPVALCAHLLRHRFLNRGRRVDRLQLDAVDPDPPLPGCLVQHRHDAGFGLGCDADRSGGGALDLDDITICLASMTSSSP